METLLSPSLFKALGEPSRISILVALAVGRRAQTVSEIAEGFSLSISVVSRHLKVLREANICLSDKRGKEVYYWLNATSLSALLRSIADALDRCCPKGQCSESES